MSLTPRAQYEECGCLTFFVIDFNALKVTYWIVDSCDQHTGVIEPYRIQRFTEVNAR